MNVNFIEYWEKAREKGKLRFILEQGLSYAIFMMIFMAIFTYFSDRENPKILTKILYMSISWIPFGFIYSSFMWWNNDRKYEKIKNQGGI